MAETWKLSLITVKLVFDLMQQLALAQAIIVERNLHAYYKLPIKVSSTLDALTPQEYHILQCPYRNSTDIPAAKDMQLCAIVNKYKDAVEDHTKVHSIKTQQRGGVKTKRLIRVHKRLPYKVVIRPVPFPCKEVVKVVRKWPTQLGVVKKTLKRRRAPPNFRNALDQRMMDTTARKVMQATTTEAPELVTTEKESDEIESAKQSIADTVKENIASDFDNAESGSDDDDGDDNNDGTTPRTVLRYLGVQQVIGKLSRPIQQPTKDAESAKLTAEKFHAEHKDFRRGEKVNGFQNYYHRDEIFNDHIFYDELQQNGHYGNRGKAQHSL